MCFIVMFTFKSMVWKIYDFALRTLLLFINSEVASLQLMYNKSYTQMTVVVSQSQWHDSSLKTWLMLVYFQHPFSSKLMMKSRAECALQDNCSCSYDTSGLVLESDPVNRENISVDSNVPRDDSHTSWLLNNWGLQSEWPQLRHHYYLSCYFGWPQESLFTVMAWDSSFFQSQS